MDRISIAVLASLDSKHAAVRFICDALTEAGATPWLVDLSLRPHQLDFADDHFFINGFAHVVDRQRRDSDRRERFHLDAGLGGNLRGGSDLDAVASRTQIDIDMLKV